MDELLDRNESRQKVNRVFWAYREHPGVIEMYGLYRTLERAYLDMLSRALQDEYKLDRVRELLDEEG